MRAVALVGFQDMCFEIVAAWPRVTGFSRGSWFVSLGTPSSQIGIPGRDPMADFAIILAQFELGQTLIFANTSAYARRLELGFVGTDSLGRKYNQQGRFIVAAAVERAPATFEAAAARVAAGDAGGANPGGGGATPDLGITAPP